MSNDPQCAQVGATLQLPRLSQLLRDLTLVETRHRLGARSVAAARADALARALGLAAADGRIPWAALALARAGRARPTPALGLDHAGALADRHRPYPDARPGHAGTCRKRESRALMQAMAPYFAQDGIDARRFTTPARWLASGEVLADLPSASLDRVRRRRRPALDAGHADAAPPAERDADAALHPSGQRRARRARPASRQFVLDQRQRPPRRAAAGRDAAPTGRRRPARRRAAGRLGALGRRPGSKIDQSACRDLLRRAATPAARRSLVLCSERHALVFAPGPGGWGDRLRRRCSRAEPATILPTNYENHHPRHSAPRRLDPGTGRRASPAGAPVRGARRQRHGRTRRRPEPPAAARRTCMGAAGRGTAAGRRHRAGQAPVHRGRLRLRRRHRLRGRHARPAPARRAPCGLHRAGPGARRLRPDGADRAARQGQRRRRADHGRQRHRQHRGRGPCARARPAGAGDRPPPAGQPRCPTPT